MACVKLLIPIIERLRDKLEYYSKIYKISMYVNFDVEAVSIDVRQLIQLKDMQTDDAIMSFDITTNLGKIICISIDVHISDRTIGNIRFLIRDLEIKDYYYNAFYESSVLFYDMKPFNINDYSEALNEKIHSLVTYLTLVKHTGSRDDGYFIKSINSLMDIDTSVVSNKNIVAILCHSCKNINKQDIIKLLPDIKHIFVEDDYENTTCWTIIDGTISKNEDLTLFEFALSLI